MARNPNHVPDPRLSAISRQNIRKRWGPPRRARLDQLDPVTRDIVVSILEAAANKAASETTVAK